jgi:two-component system, chemotaxis family, chemotaxis protein CheY
MKTLIVEDDFLARSLLTTLLAEYGVCHVVVNGSEAIEALQKAYDMHEPYDLVCLDIIMPILGGQETLLELRKIEKERGINGPEATKVIMVTAVDDSTNIMKAFREGHCEAYLTKPFDRFKLINHIKSLGLIS